jgi:hypothetical protein
MTISHPGGPPIFDQPKIIMAPPSPLSVLSGALKSLSPQALGTKPPVDRLEREGLIWEFGVDPCDPDWPRMKAQALVITLDYGRCTGIEIQLKDGALDRVYGNGMNPDPRGFGPPDIPHKRRNDD